jgi:hypothetical protein
MDQIITDFLCNLKLGELQTYRNLSIVPLFHSIAETIDYKLMNEALSEGIITITEINQSGSVPQLKVINTSPLPILLFDGEELIGAKQNRVLNTSILLKGNSETVIPVSCTEHGRWRFTSRRFMDADTIMSQRVRVNKMRTVTRSLHSDRGYSSDQGRVWSDIEDLHREAGTSSPTRAMHDVFKFREPDIKEYGESFDLYPHQKGIFVFINGVSVGFDVISNEKAYKKLHMKLVKSYAMDSILHINNHFDDPSVAKVDLFFREVLECKESRFDSVGLGYDYRFEGKSVIGSALVYEKSVHHLACFQADKGESTLRPRPF